MISHFDLEHLCQLAHLRLDPEEMARLRPQLQQIVAWVGKLSELTIDKGVDLSGENRLPVRPDAVEPSFPREKALEAAAEKDEVFIKVPKVIEER